MGTGQLAGKALTSSHGLTETSRAKECLGSLGFKVRVHLCLGRHHGMVGRALPWKPGIVGSGYSSAV